MLQLRGEILKMKSRKGILCNRFYVSEDVLIKKYYEENKLMEEICFELGCSFPTLKKYFDLYNIKRKKLIPWNKNKTKKECPSLKGNTEKGRVPWNIGLTKETDKSGRLKSMSEKSKNYKHTEKAKKLIRIKSLENWQDFDYILKNSFPYEERTCICGCGNKFICKVNSKQKFLHGHNAFAPEYCNMEGFKLGRGWSKGLTMETDSRVRNMVLKARKSVCQRPTSYEKTVIDTIIQNKLPYKYVGNGEVWIGNANPDFINTNGEKKVMEVFHDYYKILQYGSVTNYKKIRKKHYKKYGFTCLFIDSPSINKLQKGEKWKEIVPIL